MDGGVKSINHFKFINMLLKTQIYIKEVIKETIEEITQKNVITLEKMVNLKVNSKQ